MTDAHEEKLTLHIDVEIPAHADRVDTKTYRDSRPILLERVSGRCWVCGRTEKESGEPLQTHHHPIERSFANMIDFELVQADCEAGMWGPYAQHFDWDKFWKGATKVTLTINPELRAKCPDLPETITYLKPVDPYLFVDDMTVNGRVLCREHHIGKDAGYHAVPYPFVLAQKYGIEGYQFSDSQLIEHEVNNA